MSSLTSFFGRSVDAWYLGVYLHTLVEKRLDMSIFDGKCRNDETGRAAYDPQGALESGVAGLFPGVHIFSENRTGLPGACSVHRFGLWPAA